MAAAQAYANLHRQYLKANHPELFRKMQSAGTLDQHVQSVGKAASDQLDLVEKQLAQRAPTDPANRQDHLDSIPIVADELVRNDLIYQPPQKG